MTTKYVKLFENWLVEADEAVKPFDASNPGGTLVVDITVGDMFKDESVVATTLASVLNKAIAKKDSPDVEQTIKVEKFQFETKGDKEAFQKSIKESKYAFPMTNIDTNKKYFINFFDIDEETMKKLEAMAESDQTLLLVSPASGEYSKESKRESLKSRPIIELTNDVFLLGCDSNFKKWSDYPGGVGADTSILDLKKKTNFQLLTGSTITSESCNMLGLFQIMSDPNLKKTAIKSMAFKSFPKSDFNLVQVASTMGYKIPKDYSVKQGGITKTEKQA
jgi:hypothetical protein